METSHFWNERYSKDIGFEVLKTEKPSEAVVKLAKYLESKKIPFQGKVLDIGCGMGRNANWLAQKGFSVSGVDISQVAVKEASQRAQKLGLSINYQTADVSKSLPFADTSFDFVIDIVTNQLLSLDDLKSYKEEILRILEPEGKFLLYTLDRSVDKGAQQLLKDFPGPEENTYIIPQSGLVERTFTLEEIVDFWSPLNVESSELLFVPTKFEGKVYERYFWWVIFNKHENKN